MANAPQVVQLTMIKTIVRKGKSTDIILISLGSSEGLEKTRIKLLKVYYQLFT